MTEITFQAVAIDIVQIVHLFAMGIAIGTVAFADYSMLRRVYEPIRPGWARFLGRIHVFLLVAFMATWVTGLVLIWARTGFDPANFTPKLWVKLAVVTGLLGTAFGIRRIVVPRIIRGAGGTMLDLPWPSKKIIGVFAGLSLAGWSSALILGASDLLKVASFELLFSLLAGFYLTAICAIVGAFWYTHRCYGNPVTRLQRSFSAQW